jgi:1-phosphofructokinase
MKQIWTVTLNPALDKTVSVDGFEPGHTNRIRSMRLDAGGKGINVAKVLRGFHAAVGAFGCQAGNTGEAIRKKLDSLGIPHRFLEAEGETRTNLKIVDERSQVTTELNEPGLLVTPELLETLLQEYRALLDTAAVMVLAGSLPPGAPEDFYCKLIELARERGVPTILDADGPALRRGVEALPFAIKPNLDELQRLTGRKLESEPDILAAAKELVERGIGQVLVSMGGDGSLFVAGDVAIRVQPFPIRPQSTVGAGDSMVAALAYSLVKKLPVETVARLTSAAGTVTATKPGTEVCQLNEVMDKLSLVTIRYTSFPTKKEESP